MRTYTANEPTAKLDVEIKTTLYRRLENYCQRHHHSKREVLEFILTEWLTLAT